MSYLFYIKIVELSGVSLVNISSQFLRTLVKCEKLIVEITD